MSPADDHSRAAAAAAASTEPTGDNDVDNVIVAEPEGNAMEGDIRNFDLKPSHEAKIRELLRNINSVELKLCVDGSKEFKKLLRGRFGGELLHQYVKMSSNFIELLEAWKRRQGKQGFSYVLKLIAEILDHSEGKYRPNDPDRIGVSRILDKFAKLIISDKLDEIYRALNGKESSAIVGSLLLLAAIVKRGLGLATEVSKNFNFELPGFPKLAEYKKEKVERRKYATRGAFIEFAMSFLEVGKLGLLRWILQQRKMFYGVLRGLGNDDDETVVYVLSTLRDRVLSPDSMLPPGIRSVLFGSVTLEQLISISARENGGLAADVAHEVLVMVCTDPSNGLMPDLKRQPIPLKGNPKRLLDLMKKLKATEIGYHRDLLMAIVSGRPSLGSAYLDELPYNMEDLASPTWLSAVSLAANLVSSVRAGISWDFLNQRIHDPSSFNSSDVQSILKCVCPRPFSRSVINKGLLHSDPLVKHGTLRLLLEDLNILNSFIEALGINGLASLKQEVQNEVRIQFPDPQVLFTLLNSLNGSYKSSRFSLKRRAGSKNVSQENQIGNKKLKMDAVNEDIDILVGGINYPAENVLSGDHNKASETFTTSKFVDEKDDVRLSEIWGLHQCSTLSDTIQDVELYFHCKVLEALKMYHRTLHAVMEVSYDIFKLIPSNPLELPSILLQSLLSTLIEHLGLSCDSGFPSTDLPPIYKYLQHFINLLIHLSSQEIKDQARVLAEAALLSTGAFDHNPWEIQAWFLFLPGYARDSFCAEQEGRELVQTLSPAVVSFVCDAVSTVGNNLIKYWDIVKSHLFNLKYSEEMAVDFNPLVVCILEKCLRLLSSQSATSTVPEKSMVSLYVCNTLKYLLQTQAKIEILASLIHRLLSERIQERFSAVADATTHDCEWRPVVYLWLFSQSILCQNTWVHLSVGRGTSRSCSTFLNTLSEVQNVLSSSSSDLVAISKAFYSTLICTAPDEIVDHLPLVMSILQKLPGPFHAFLASIFFLDQNVVGRVRRLWPDMFLSGLGISVTASTELTEESDQSTTQNQHEYFISVDNAAIGFSSFLKEAPFHVLFPAIIVGALKRHIEIKDLLLAKLSALTADQIVSFLRLVLFWFHQIRLAYREKRSKGLEHVSEVCYVLVEHILAQMLTMKVESGCSATRNIPLFQCAQEVAKIVFSHPLVMAALSIPLESSSELSEKLLTDTLEGFPFIPRERYGKMDHHVVNLLITTSDCLIAVCSDQDSSSTFTQWKINTMKALNTLIERIILIFKERLNLWCTTQDPLVLFPIVHFIFALMRFISPIMLLELVNWLFSRVDLCDQKLEKNSNVSPIDLGFAIAGSAFGMLSRYMGQPNMRLAPYDLLWGPIRKFDARLFKSICFKAFEFATNVKLGFADMCLLKAANLAHLSKYGEDNLSLGIEMARVVASFPVNIISHCIHGTSSCKARLLFLLLEMSPLHLSVFGQLISDIVNQSFAQFKSMEQGPNTLLDDEYLMLIPAVLSYLNSALAKFGKQYFRRFENVLTFYSRLLVDGFLDWKRFVSRAIFQVESSDVFPSSSEDLVDLFRRSLLGKSVNMLQYYFAISDNSKDECMKLYLSISLRSGLLDDLIDFDRREINSYAPEELLNLVNKVVAKVSFCLVMLFPEHNQINVPPQESYQGEELPGSGSCEEGSSKVKFIDVLADTWQLIVRKFPSPSEETSSIDLLFKSLEVFLLRCICQLVIKMRNALIHLDSLPFLETMARFSLLHRFGDSTTFEILRCILSSLSEGNVPVALFLQLLLGHSQLGTAFRAVIDASSSSIYGMNVKPLSSLLRLQVISTNCNDAEKPKKYMKQLEIIKLLRILFHLKAHLHGSAFQDVGINSTELYFMLLSCYGATLSEFDLELYSVLHEIESCEGMKHDEIAEVDFLWGCAALRVRKEHLVEQNVLLDNNIAEMEVDGRRRLFRDNFPFDPKLCAATVVHFPYQRTAMMGNTLPLDMYQIKVKNPLEQNSAEAGRVQCYDPVFILRFSIHILSMDYMDPVEFAGLGLLAIALVSLSSPEDDIRKLGYEVLGRFKHALEGCRKKKEVMGLCLLLTYLQNGIEEPWQKIPSIIAVFVAEASLILLDPSHDHHTAIREFLMRTPRVNLKSVPLFNDYLWSSSVNFKADRMWILRLVYAGINLEDDALIYMKNSVIETMLIFYASPLSENESKELILQVVKRSVKVPKMARYLVENCNLISWLSSILSSTLGHCGDQEICFSRQLINLLEVANDVVSSESSIEWLQNFALEQLSDLSCHLFKLLVCGSKLVQKNSSSVILVLKGIKSALRISQERKIYQTHFIPSSRFLYQLYEAVRLHDNGKSSHCAELALEAILMSTPTVTIFDLDQKELSTFLTWAVSTAVSSDSQKKFQESEICSRFSVRLEDTEDSLMSKLLHWLIASVILKRTSCQQANCDSSFTSGQPVSRTFLSLMTEFQNGCEETRNEGAEEILAGVIFYLHQLLGFRCRVLSSVVAALSILLLTTQPYAAGSVIDPCNDDLMSLWSKIRCPPEANPAWTWSYHQPWEDDTSAQTDLEKMEEIHACQTLLVIFSQILEKKSSSAADFELLSPQDLERSSLYEWEKNILKIDA